MADLSNAISRIQIDRFIVAASLAILFYDYLLTFPLEVELYWFHGRFSWASLFFFMNRYVAVLGHVPVILEYFANTPGSKSCHALQFYHHILSAAMAVIVLILLIMRTYALFQRNRAVLALLLLATLGSISFGAWAVFSAEHLPQAALANLNLGPCSNAITPLQGNRLAAAWGVIMGVDTLVFFLTLYRRLQVGRTPETSLYTIMVRDGIVYFGTLMGLYLCDILVFVLANPLHKGISVTVTNVIACTLMSRMMLNIRNPEGRAVGGMRSQPAEQYRTQWSGTIR